MLTIVKSVLNSTEESRALVISSILEDIEKDLNPQELKVFRYLKNGYDTYSQFQTEELFLQQFPEYRSALNEVSVLDTSSLDYYRREFEERHKRNSISKKLLTMASTLQQTGLTPDMVEALRDSVTGNPNEDITLETSNVIDLYTESKKKGNSGIKTYIPEIDQIIGSIEPGTLTTVVGYSGHGKTTCAVNIAYKSAKSGKNVVYISLEVPERDLLYDLISLHSTDLKFGIETIPHSCMRMRSMDKQQEDNFKKVAEDFNNTILPNFHILTERNFKEFSYGEIRDTLYRLDNKKPIDTIFVDQASLFKYYGKGRVNDTNALINEYVSFFRRLAICFKVEKGKDRQMIVVLLAQCNRTGFLKAIASGKKDPTMEGKYDDTAVSEAHELSRAASYVITVYSSEAMRLSKEARVQLLKSRFGQTHEDPISVNFNPEFYQFGEMDDVSSNVNNYSTASSFDSFLDINPADIGFNLSAVDLSDL